MTMVPEAWQNDILMPADKKAFYRWSAFAMEPWDGPGEIIHTVMTLSFRTDRSVQTVQTGMQSDQGLHCLLFHLHLFDEIP